MVGGAIAAVACFLCFLLGIAQSYIGQWWASPPAYPHAVLTERVFGRACTPTLAVYCVESSYRAPDPPDRVVAYYQSLRSLRFWTPMQFATEHASPYGDQQSARYCRYVIGYKSCVQISIHALNGGSEIYILELGGSQSATFLGREQ